jgi:hypothetical protein
LRSPAGPPDTGAKEIAGAVLDELKKEGKAPARERINLSVRAQQDAGKGMTGKPLTGPFGRTVYNYKSGPS